MATHPLPRRPGAPATLPPIGRFSSWNSVNYLQMALYRHRAQPSDPCSRPAPSRRIPAHRIHFRRHQQRALLPWYNGKVGISSQSTGAASATWPTRRGQPALMICRSSTLRPRWSVSIAAVQSHGHPSRTIRSIRAGGPTGARQQYVNLSVPQRLRSGVHRHRNGDPGRGAGVGNGSDGGRQRALGLP